MTQRNRDRGTEKQRERERETERETDRERNRERERERERERQAETERESEGDSLSFDDIIEASSNFFSISRQHLKRSIMSRALCLFLFHCVCFKTLVSVIHYNKQSEVGSGKFEVYCFYLRKATAALLFLMFHSPESCLFGVLGLALIFLRGIVVFGKGYI